MTKKSDEELEEEIEKAAEEEVLGSAPEEKQYFHCRICEGKRPFQLIEGEFKSQRSKVLLYFCTKCSSVIVDLDKYREITRKINEKRKENGLKL